MRQNLLAILPLILILSLLFGGPIVPTFVGADSPGGEAVELRTENSKTTYLGGGRYAWDGSLGAIHYRENPKDGNSSWLDIDTTISPSGIVTKAPYDLQIYLTGNPGFHYKSKDSGEFDIRLKGFREQKTAGSILPPLPRPIIKDNQVIWSTPDIDIIVEVQNTRVYLRTVVKNENALNAFATKDVELEYDYSETPGKAQLVCRANDKDKPLDITYEKKDGKLYERVDLKNAVYPVRIDPAVDEIVGHTNDDCWRQLTPSNWRWDSDGNGIAGRASATYKQYGTGQRFTTVNIPNAATITLASLNLTCETARTATTVKTRISAEDIDTAPAIADDRDAFDTRWANRTTARVDWDIDYAWVLNTEYPSPDIKDVIKEIVDRPGWVSGNDILIFWEDYADRTTDNAYRDDWHYNGSSTKCPKLHVEYAADVPPTVVSGTSTNTTSTTSDLGGNITATGGVNPDERGFDWDTDSGVPYANSWTESGSYGTGTFSYTITSLTCNTPIYWRAKAHNTEGWGYGSEQNFTTGPCPPDAPGDFTATSLGGNLVALNWTKAVDANADTTLIIGQSGRYPKDRTDGWVAYNGTAESTTDSRGISFDLENPYYRAWSYNMTSMFSTDYAQANLGGGSMLMLGFIGIAIFFTWFSHRTRDLLICAVSFLVWLGMGFWLFFSGSAPFDLNEGYVQILTYVFFIMAFVPLLLSMNQEIKHEASGKKWTTYGQPPNEIVNAKEAYKKRLRTRINNRR